MYIIEHILNNEFLGVFAEENLKNTFSKFLIKYLSDYDSAKEETFNITTDYPPYTLKGIISSSNNNDKGYTVILKRDKKEIGYFFTPDLQLANMFYDIVLESRLKLSISLNEIDLIDDGKSLRYTNWN